MIYIETDMKEMRKGCGGCRYEYTDYKERPYCVVGNQIKNKTRKYRYERPSWCPLVEKE